MTTSHAPTLSTPAPTGLRRAMRQHPLLFFFLIAYAFSWITLIPFILAGWGILPTAMFYNIFFIVKSFGPALAAYIIIRVTEGKEGLHDLRRRLTQWRAGWQWYLFILLGVPALMLLGICALPGALASFRGLPPYAAASYLISFVIIALGGGPLGEEPGWRGFALPRMQSRYGALRANLLLGVMWTFWHLPDFLTSAQKGGAGTDLSVFYVGLPVFFLEVMALVFVFTWVFNHTGGSVLIAIILHASYNTFGTAAQPLFSAPSVTGTDLPFAIGMGVLALLILLLTRGQLGYRPGRESPLSLGHVEA
ncbi:MAG: CPBP family intramembrane metalloprotease [Kouleothrix sp.]|nr:CPBP family intramembrane metalloprotease [Kouleothrix sp.]